MVIISHLYLLYIRGTLKMIALSGLLYLNWVSSLQFVPVLSVCVCVNLDSNACVGLFEWGTTTKSADELVVLKFVPCKKSGIPSQNGRFKLSLPVMLVRIDNIQLLSTRTFINTFLCGCVFVYLIYIFMYMRWNWWASEACKFLYEAARVVVFSKFNLALKLNFFFNTTRDLTSKCSDQ